MIYKRYLDESKRLTVAIEGMPRLRYAIVSWRLRHRFGLKKISTIVSTMDEKFQEYEKNGFRISIDWDIWSGFTVTALEPSSEKLVTEIGEWLKKSYTN